jgi:hypothetical protein
MYGFGRRARRYLIGRRAIAPPSPILTDVSRA